MTIDILREMLFWCAVLNMSGMLFALVMFAAAGDLIHRIHGYFFTMSRQSFDTTVYASLGIYKILIFIFNIVPYIALRIVT